jgi:flagellar hook-length control protein FliK
MDPAAGRTGPQDPKPRMEPVLSRPEPPAAAPMRGAESDPAGAVARDGGNPPASGKEDPEPFSFALAREKASADEAPEEARAENATLPSARETAEPGASHAIAAGRNAAESAPGPRPPIYAPAAAHPQRTFHAGENAFVLTRKSDTSVEITLSPPGVGRLEIEVVVDKGVVNANITAADPAGREAIERSLPQIVQALADEGMSIGGFTVSLKQDNGQDGNAQAGNAQAGKGPGSGSSGADAPGAVRSAAGRSGLVDILV